MAAFFKEFLTQSDLLAWPLIGFCIFLAAFLIVLVKVFFGMGRGEKLDRVASLPLSEDEIPSASEGHEGATRS